MSIPVYTSEQMRQWDAFTIEKEPIASIDLMERAASMASKVILGRNLFNSVAIFCGPGNNGGDGLVIARLLSASGKKVEIFHLKFAEESEDFKTNFKKLPDNIPVTELSESSHQIDANAELIIDSIFGSGLNRPIEGWIAKVIDQVNTMQGKKIAIDIPSGLFANENDKNTSHSVFRANETLSFMSPKMPFFFEAYVDYVGSFRLLDIGLLPAFSAESIASFITSDDIHVKPRSVYDHKGKNGYLTLIGGLDEMTGAVVISARAAMKSGVGYVNAISSKNARVSLNSVIPEVIWQNSKECNISDKTTAIAIGPGLGQSEQAFHLLNDAIKVNKPMVVDADGINILSEHPALLENLPKNTILTPHIGELKRLVGTAESEEDLLQKQLKFSRAYKLYIIQKGPYSKLTTPEGKIFINSTGNPGMATAGMGDALTGLIGSLLAQGYSSEEAAKIGMFIHGYSADEHLKNVGVIGILASDVIQGLPQAMNKFIRI